MSRLMSVAFTEVAARRKTVTRRLGWWEDKNGRRLLKPGDHLTLCRKVMGRKREDGTVEPLVRIAEVEVVSVRREALLQITRAEVAREGFPDWDRWDFIRFFVRSMKCDCLDDVTRIEWRYLSVGGAT